MSYLVRFHVPLWFKFFLVILSGLQGPTLTRPSFISLLYRYENIFATVMLLHTFSLFCGGINCLIESLFS